VSESVDTDCGTKQLDTWLKHLADERFSQRWNWRTTPAHARADCGGRFSLLQLWLLLPARRWNLRSFQGSNGRGMLQRQ
jgi:hypothetical protein